jgi:hypothetical protein
MTPAIVIAREGGRTGHAASSRAQFPQIPSTKAAAFVSLAELLNG